MASALASLRFRPTTSTSKLPPASWRSSFRFPLASFYSQALTFCSSSTYQAPSSSSHPWPVAPLAQAFVSSFACPALVFLLPVSCLPLAACRWPSFWFSHGRSFQAGLGQAKDVLRCLWGRHQRDRARHHQDRLFWARRMEVYWFSPSSSLVTPSHQAAFVHSKVLSLAHRFGFRTHPFQFEYRPMSCEDGSTKTRFCTSSCQNYLLPQYLMMTKMSCLIPHIQSSFASWLSFSVSFCSLWGHCMSAFNLWSKFHPWSWDLMASAHLGHVWIYRSTVCSPL